MVDLRQLAEVGVLDTRDVRDVDVPVGAMYRMSVENAALIRVRADGERPPTLVFRRPAPPISPGEPEA